MGLVAPGPEDSSGRCVPDTEGVEVLVGETGPELITDLDDW